MSVAFDIVVHEQLIEDLIYIGIGNAALEWFKIYLEDLHVIIKERQQVD